MQRMLFKDKPEMRRFGLSSAYYPCYRNQTESLHQLDADLFSIVVRGRCRHMNGDHIYLQNGPSIGITPRGVRHSILTEDAGIEIYNLLLDPEKLRLPMFPAELNDALLAILPLGRQTNWVARINLTNSRCIAIMAALHREIQEQPPGCETAARAYLELFLLEACRDATASGLEIAAEKRVPGQFRLEKIRQYMDKEFRKPLSLHELAALAGLNPNYLCRAFHAYCGKTIFDYLIERRINAAMQRLRQSDEKIINIASECGFSDLSNFNRAFKRINGISPSAYRKI